MAATRQTMTPVNMNGFPLAATLGIVGAVAPAAGCDYNGSNTTFTAWASLPNASSLGIQYLNNGSQWIWGYNGATTSTAYVLIGQKAGGLTQIYSAYSLVLPTSGYFAIPPLSPAQFNQQDASQAFTGTTGGVIGTGGVGFTCIDFLNTTTVAVRLYQLTTVTP
ncbi:MAG: hypothetical protein ACRDOK_02620 [Streptosporangiaceae bacterium]